MKLVSTFFKTVLTFNENSFTSLIIEHQGLFRKTLEDFIAQLNGDTGEYIFSINDTPKPFRNHIELLQQWVPFELNSKTLQSALFKAVEKIALSRENFTATHHLLESIRSKIQTWALELPHETEVNELSVPSLLKAVGLTFTNRANLVEQIIAYCCLVRDLIGEKLFVFVNLRSYLNDSELDLLMTDLLSKKINILLLESTERSCRPTEKRLIIDTDLCEFGWKHDII